jgi:hypothetical protein
MAQYESSVATIEAIHVTSGSLSELLALTQSTGSDPAPPYITTQAGNLTSVRDVLGVEAYNHYLVKVPTGGGGHAWHVRSAVDFEAEYELVP